MEFVQRALRKTGLISIVESVIFMILGIILIVKAEAAVKVISYIFGGIFILIGLLKTIAYFFTRKDDFAPYTYDLIYGLMSIVIGIITIYYSSTIETILRVIIGIWIIYSALVKFSLTLKIRSLESKAWFVSLILSIIMFACGLFIILNSGTIVVTIGIMIVVYAVLDIIEDIICMIKLREIF